jgi:hypothetical protein
MIRRKPEVPAVPDPDGADANRLGHLDRDLHAVTGDDGSDSVAAVEKCNRGRAAECADFCAETHQVPLDQFNDVRNDCCAGCEKTAQVGAQIRLRKDRRFRVCGSESPGDSVVRSFDRASGKRPKWGSPAVDKFASF